MAHARRSLRNHHGKPHEHAPGDPLGVYLPPLAKWDRHAHGHEWAHPSLPIRFVTWKSFRRDHAWSGWAQKNPEGLSNNALSAQFHGGSEAEVRGALARWYALHGDAYVSRRSERNPDWSAMRAKASHYGSRAATGAREAYAWTAPRAKRAAEVTWEGAKSAGRAVKRGAKRAAPVVARGARSAAEGLDRWSQTNGRHNSGEPWGYYNGIQLNVYSSGGRRTEVYVSVYARGLAKRTPVEIVEAIHRAMGGNPEGNRISWDRSIDMKRLGRVVEKAAK